MVAAGAGGGGGEFVFNWHRVSVSDEKVLEMDGGWPHTNVCVFSASELYT